MRSYCRLIQPSTPRNCCISAGVLAIHSGKRAAMTRGPTSEIPPRPERGWRRYLPLLLAGISGLGLSITVPLLMRHCEWRHIQSDFQVAAQARASAVTTAVDEDRYILRSILMFFETDEEVSRSEFRKLVDSLTPRGAGIQALVWGPPVLPLLSGPPQKLPHAARDCLISRLPKKQVLANSRGQAIVRNIFLLIISSPSKVTRQLPDLIFSPKLDGEKPSRRRATQGERPHWRGCH